MDCPVNHDGVFNNGDGIFGAVFEEEAELIWVDKFELNLKWNVEGRAELGTSHGLASIDQRGEIGKLPLMNAFDGCWNKIDILSHLVKKIL